MYTPALENVLWPARFHLDLCAAVERRSGEERRMSSLCSRSPLLPHSTDLLALVNRLTALSLSQSLVSSRGAARFYLLGVHPCVRTRICSLKEAFWVSIEDWRNPNTQLFMTEVEASCSGLRGTTCRDLLAYRRMRALVSSTLPLAARKGPEFD